jgi:hypothetical protein
VCRGCILAVDVANSGGLCHWAHCGVCQPDHMVARAQSLLSNVSNLPKLFLSPSCQKTHVPSHMAGYPRQIPTPTILSTSTPKPLHLAPSGSTLTTTSDTSKSTPTCERKSAKTHRRRMPKTARIVIPTAGPRVREERNPMCLSARDRFIVNRREASLAS